MMVTRQENFQQNLNKQYDNVAMTSLLYTQILEQLS
jgi:hypothetical protein